MAMQGHIVLNKVIIRNPVESYVPGIQVLNPNTQIKRAFLIDRNGAFEGIAKHNRGLRIIM